MGSCEGRLGFGSGESKFVITTLGSTSLSWGSFAVVHVCRAWPRFQIFHRAVVTVSLNIVTGGLQPVLRLDSAKHRAKSQFAVNGRGHPAETP